MDPMTAWATRQAQQFLAERKVAVSTQFPWLQYSDQTKLLQARINETGRQRVNSGIDEGYCKIDEDGKLGPGTCGAARAVGVPTPSTCQSFATDCRGTWVSQSGAVRKPKPKPTPAPAPAPAPAPTPEPSAYRPPSGWLSQLWARQPGWWMMTLGIGAAVGVTAAMTFHGGFDAARRH
jgi:hypothetical protein